MVSPTPAELQQENKELQRELYGWYNVICRHATGRLGRLIKLEGVTADPLACFPDTDEEFRAWLRQARQLVLDLGSKQQAGSGWNGRAPCPLCDEVPTNAYSQAGFTVPEGLRRHLDGSGKTEQCYVMRAAILLAEHHLDYSKERALKDGAR